MVFPFQILLLLEPRLWNTWRKILRVQNTHPYMKVPATSVYHKIMWSIIERVPKKYLFVVLSVRFCLHKELCQHRTFSILCRCSGAFWGDLGRTSRRLSIVFPLNRIFSHRRLIWPLSSCRDVSFTERQMYAVHRNQELRFISEKWGINNKVHAMDMRKKCEDL